MIHNILERHYILKCSEMHVSLVTLFSRLEKVQKCVDRISDSCDSYDLIISIKKIEMVYQPAPGKPYKDLVITVKGQQLQVVDKFTYLGSTFSRVVHIDDDEGLPKLVKHLAVCTFTWKYLGSKWNPT